MDRIGYHGLVGFFPEKYRLERKGGSRVIPFFGVGEKDRIQVI